MTLSGSGSATASQLFAPYGGVRYSSGTMPTSYGFTGQRADAASGLDYYGARYYDPLADQFSSGDSVLPDGGFDLWGLSRYAYVGGNPIDRTDPTGHINLMVGDDGNSPAPIDVAFGGTYSWGSGAVTYHGDWTAPYRPLSKSTPPPPPDPAVGITCGCNGAGAGGVAPAGVPASAPTRDINMVGGSAGMVPVVPPTAATPQDQADIDTAMLTWLYDHPEYDPTGVAALIHVIRDGPQPIDLSDPSTLIAIALMADGGRGPAGRRGGPIRIQPGTNIAAQIDGVRYTGHALDEMQGRGIPPSVVKNTIQHGARSPGYDGATVIYDSTNDVTVVENPDGSVKTVYPGGG